MKFNMAKQKSRKKDRQICVIMYVLCILYKERQIDEYIER